MEVVVHFVRTLKPTPAKPQQHASGESTLHIINDFISRSDPFKLSFQVQPADIPGLLSRIDIQNGLQCTYDNEYNFVVQRVLRLPHESVATGLGLDLMGLRTNLLPPLRPGGTPTMEQEGGHDEQADFPFGLKYTGPAYPPAVIIICDSESVERHEANARGWLESSILQNPRRPTLRIQNWVLAPRSEARPAKEFDWTDGIDEDYIIDTQLSSIRPRIPDAMSILDRAEQKSWRSEVIKPCVASNPE